MHLRKKSVHYFARNFEVLTNNDQNNPLSFNLFKIRIEVPSNCK